MNNQSNITAFSSAVMHPMSDTTRTEAERLADDVRIVKELIDWAYGCPNAEGKGHLTSVLFPAARAMLERWDAAALLRARRGAEPQEWQLQRDQLLASIEPFASIGAWLFARPEVPDHEVMVTIEGINGLRGAFTRGQFKAAYRAFEAASKNANAASQGRPCIPDEPHCQGPGSSHVDSDGRERCDLCGCLINVKPEPGATVTTAKTATKERFDDDGLLLEPQDISGNAWFYEERKGIIVVQEVRDANGVYITTTQLVIPWAKLRASVQRKDRGEAAKKRKR